MIDLDVLCDITYKRYLSRLVLYMEDLYTHINTNLIAHIYMCMCNCTLKGWVLFIYIRQILKSVRFWYLL